MKTAMVTSTNHFQRDNNPKVGSTKPCKAKKTTVKYCQLMQATLDHNKSVQHAIRWKSGAELVVYARKKADPYMVWNVCPYCGESLIPLAARSA